MCVMQKKHDSECAKLRLQKFVSIEHKNDALRAYCKKYLTRDVRKALFVELDCRGDESVALELGILRGFQKYWVIDQFIKTDNGFLPRWYLENSSVHSVNV